MMRFLIDQCLSPLIAVGLRQRGHDSVHASELGLSEAADDRIIEAAREQSRVILTADNDFAMLLAFSRSAGPSVILLKEDAPAAAVDILALLDLNLSRLQEPLESGAIVAVHASRMRVRRLPL